jgi:hypothetical protein
MPLVNALPIAAFPGSPWSASAPQQALELITTWSLDELTALSAPPDPDLAWADVGSNTALGVGIVKFAHALPSSMNFTKFKPGGARDYKTLDVIASRVEVNPYDLSFGIPMIWNEIANGWQLMSQGPNNTLIEFAGVSGLGADYVVAGKAYKCQLVASLFYSGLYATTGGLSVTTPTALAYGGAALPLNPNGIALFSDGTGAEGTAGATHFANPTVASSGRFKNVWFGFGSFESNYGASLVKMTVKPHSTLPNKTSGARVTDTFGPTTMRDKFWRMMVQSLTMQSAEVGGNGVAAATTNPYAEAVARGLSEENFIGTAFGPRRFWILPELDNHPYMVQNPTADFWINVSAGKDPSTGGARPSWAKLASNSKDFVPTFRFYGPGDPRAMSERMMRFEGDLDGGVAGGVPGVVDMFGSV